MKIVLVSAEFAPFAKSGGLADATTSLAKGLASLGHEVYCFMPNHGVIDRAKFKLNPTFLTLNVELGMRTEFAHLLRYDNEIGEPNYYFVEHDMLFKRDGIYGNEDEYLDNDKRFIFFSRSVFEACKALDIEPDVIHAHDNHTAFVMPFLKNIYSREERFSKTVGTFTIHNLAYQGKYNQYRAMDYSTFGMKNFYNGSWFEHYGVVNSMKVGIMFADKVTTVSPNYANEIKLHYYGETLHDELNERAGDLFGVLNGVDYNIWTPEYDDLIFENYSIDTLGSKEVNKLRLLEEVGIVNQETPLLGIVTRLTEQKGIDLLIKKLDYFLESGKINLVVLGSGERRFVEYFDQLVGRYPGRVSVEIGYNESKAHKIIAGSDYFIIPSRFEPCGLTQMYCLKYGTVPIVRHTGGLADTISEYSIESGDGNGFVFYNYNAEDMADALYRALSIYKAKNHWDRIRNNGMAVDNSFTKSAEKYVEVYQKAIG